MLKPTETDEFIANPDQQQLSLFITSGGVLDAFYYKSIHFLKSCR